MFFMYELGEKLPSFQFKFFNVLVYLWCFQAETFGNDKACTTAKSIGTDSWKVSVAGYFFIFSSFTLWM